MPGIERPGWDYRAGDDVQLERVIAELGDCVLPAYSQAVSQLNNILEVVSEAASQAISQTESELTALISQAESELDLVSEAVVAVDSQLLLAESEIADLDSQLLLIESEAADNASQILLLESETATNSANIAAAESELDLVSEALVAVDSQLLLVESEVASNDSEILLLESEVAAAESELDLVSEAVVAAESEIATKIPLPATPSTGDLLEWNGSAWVPYAQSNIDHNALTNYVANEHIDWTNAGVNFKTSGSITSTGGDLLLANGYEAKINTFRALALLDAGNNTLAIGKNAAFNLTTGTKNAALGSAALGNCTEGVENIGVGFEAGRGNTTGNYNISIGSSSLYKNTGGSNNICVGRLSGGYNGTGGSFSNCILIGGSSGARLTTGSANILFGTNCGAYLTTGANNVLAGYYSGYSLTGSSNVFLGYASGYRQTAVSNMFLVDCIARADAATELTNAILYGIMAATPASQQLFLHAVTQIGTPTNYSEFEADGTLEFNGNARTWNDINMGGAVLSVLDVATLRDEFIDEAGSDTGIETWALGVGEGVQGSFELIHDYAEGTDLYFHVHWQGIVAPTGTDKVQWQLTYTVARTGATLDAPITIVIETDFDTQYEFTRSDFAAITGTNFLVGDQFLFRIERIAASTDEYGGDALLATVGIHYQQNTVGSRTLETK